MQIDREEYFNNYLTGHPSISSLDRADNEKKYLVDSNGLQILFELSEARVTASITFPDQNKAASSFWSKVLYTSTKYIATDLELRFLEKEGLTSVASRDCSLIQICSPLIEIQDDELLKNSIDNIIDAVNLLFDNAVVFASEAEGESYLASIKRYERSSILRQRAIEIHGTNCAVCGFNFQKTYGSLGENFIHIHHLERIADKGIRLVDPKTDLVPVCPNCHAMLHKKTPPYLPEELSRIISEVT